MAGVNSIQGSLVLHEFSEDNVVWKTLVCAQGGKFESTTNVTTEKTKCGPIKGVDDPDWKMSGDAVANVKPTAGQVSYSDMLRWQQAKQLIYVRLQSPADNVLNLEEGEAFFHAGEAYVTNVTIDNSNGAVVKFTWSLEGQGVLVTGRPPIITTQPTGGTITAPAALTRSVVADGIGALTYQWFKGTVSLGSSNGAQTATYSKAATVAGTDSGIYTVQITDGTTGSKTTSSPVTITVS